MLRTRAPRRESTGNITPEIINACLNISCLAHISKKAGVNKSTITYRREKLGLTSTPLEFLNEEQMKLLLLPKKRKTPPRNVKISQEMIQSYLDGNSAQVVADEYSISASTLTRRLRSLDLIRNSKEACELSISAGRHYKSKNKVLAN